LTCSCGKSQNKYIDIPRTKVSIIQPEGSKLLKYQTGLIKDNELSIMILEYTSSNYIKDVSNFNKSNYESRGLKVSEEKETTVDDFPAKIIFSNSGSPELNTMMLMFGDNSFSVTVVCNYKSNDKSLENKLKEILLSIKYNKNKKVDPFENTHLTIDTISSSFRFKSFLANNYVFSPSRQENPKENSFVTLTTTEFEKSMSLEGLVQMGINRLKERGNYGYMNDTTSKYKIDDYDALLSIGDFYAGTEQKYLYQLVLVKGDLCTMVVGICDFKDEKMKSEINKFCQKIRLTN
jgi:hypothetical protein